MVFVNSLFSDIQYKIIHLCSLILGGDVNFLIIRCWVFYNPI